MRCGCASAHRSAIWPPSDQPTTTRGERSAANAASSRRDDAVDRERPSRRAEAVPRQIDRVDAIPLGKRRGEAAPHARVHRPSVQQRERRTVTGRFDVQHALHREIAAANAGASSASAAQSASTSARRMRRSQRYAQPRGALRDGRRADRRNPETPLQQRRGKPDSGALAPTISGWIAVRESRKRERERAHPLAKPLDQRARCARRARVVADHREARAQRLGQQRRGRRRVDVRTRRLHQRLDDGRMRGDERARDTRGLAQRAHVARCARTQCPFRRAIRGPLPARRSHARRRPPATRRIRRRARAAPAAARGRRPC